MEKSVIGDVSRHLNISNENGLWEIGTYVAFEWDVFGTACHVEENINRTAKLENKTMTRNKTIS